MSGGVDSSVASALLKEQGHKVIGVFMKPWQPFGKSFCLWKQDREDALRAAATIGIPLLTWDFSKEYKKLVTDYMIREYKSGRTPNPDVMCNKEIKFGLFFKKAIRAGADFIATGHYVKKIKNQKSKNKNSEFELWQAKDKNKDQSYFLWTLTSKQISKCLFPVGGYLKPEVRKLAKKFKLPNACKKDSQGVCFIGPLDMKEFLLKYIKPKKGKILTMDKKEIGTHDGVFYYTIGQRHGLDIKNGAGPYYVVSKDIKNNIIFVGSDNQSVSLEAKIGEFNWLTKPILPKELDVKVRYRTKSVKAVLGEKGVLKFKKPERAVTSGQSAVFYRGTKLIGGGIIQ